MTRKQLFTLILLLALVGLSGFVALADSGSSKAAGGRLELGPRDLPAQDLELVAQHQQLDVFTCGPRRPRTRAPSRARTAR